MKRHLQSLILLLPFIVAIFFTGTCLKASNSSEIVAGQSIGLVSIGDNRTYVLQKLGKPTISITEAGYTHDSFGTSKTEDIIGVIYKDEKVIQISTIYPRYRTKEGVRRGSSWHYVNKYYKPFKIFSIGPKDEDPEHVFNYYVSRSRGISFLFDNSGWPPVVTKETSVFAVTVFKKNSGPLVLIGKTYRLLK